MIRKAILLGGVMLAVAGCGGKAGPRPNVIVVTLDTFRADRLGALGHPGKLTPNLDALAQEAALFAAAITPIGTTHPSHASMFTGKFPGGHGVRFNGDGLTESEQTLAERLSEQGYDTAGFVSKRTLFVRGGFEQGFRYTTDEKGETGTGQGAQRSGQEVNRLVTEWLDDDPDEPVFLWVHYFGAHSPYAWTDLARQRFGEPRGPLSDGATAELFYAYGSEELPATEENRAALNALYDGELAEVDRDVGALLRLLEERGVLKDAVVLVVGDHGQLLGEHGDVGHGFQLFDPVLRVPFLIWRSADRTGRLVGERVSLIDLLPTVLDLLGLESPRTPGRSLVPALEGRRFAEVPQFASVRSPKLSQGKVRGGGGGKGHDKSVAVYFGANKLILGEENRDVFDLSADPDELAPLDLTGGEGEGLLQKLLPHGLLHLMRERPSEEILDLPEDVLQEMRELGYIE